MTRLCVLVLVAGCRIGFDAAPVATTDGALPLTCSADADCGRCQRCEQGACERATFVDVDLDYRNGCALDERGELWCWGDNSYLIADPTALFDEVVPRPRRLSLPEPLDMIAVGRGAGLVRTTSGVLRSIGSEGGDVNAAGTWRGLSAGNLNACAIGVTDTAWCAGVDDNAQLGDGMVTNAAQPLRQWGIPGFLQVAAGNTTCAIDDSSRLFCVGRNVAGELGRGVRSPYEPNIAQVGTAFDWASVRIAEDFVCGLRIGGGLSCWGGGPGGDVTMPAQVLPATGWSDLDAVYRAACALRGTQLYCVGDQSPMLDALLGRAYTTNVAWEQMPITVDAGTAPVIGGHSACVKQNGAWMCWGDNTNGAVGVDVPGLVGPTPLCE